MTVLPHEEAAAAQNDKKEKNAGLFMQFFIPAQTQPNSCDSFESKRMLFVQLDFFWQNHCIDS